MHQCQHANISDPNNQGNISRHKILCDFSTLSGFGRTTRVISMLCFFKKNEIIFTARKQSCRKVMFSHLSISHSVHKGACVAGVVVCVAGGVHGRGACKEGDMYHRGHAWWGACVAGGVWQAGHAWQGCVCGGCMYGWGMRGRGDCCWRGRYTSNWNTFLF